MPAPDRIAIGRDNTFSERVYAWLSADAIEVDEVDGYDVTRRRVLLDEVCLVTLHRARRIGLLVLWGAFAAVLAWPMMLARGKTMWVPFFVLSMPFAIAFLFHLVLGTDYVTVFGRRSKARVAFQLRKDRARDVFEQVIIAVDRAQARARPPATLAGSAGPASDESPPGAASAG